MPAMRNMHALTGGDRSARKISAQVADLRNIFARIWRESRRSSRFFHAKVA
jgi:hypothetical protein